MTEHDDAQRAQAPSAPDELVRIVAELAADDSAERVARSCASFERAYRAFGEDARAHLLREILRGPAPAAGLLDRLGSCAAGIRSMLAMRRDVLDLGARSPALAALDQDLREALAGRFTTASLEYAAIELSSPLEILEHLILGEAVHPVAGWADLRRRLDPHDRRCFGAFHPVLGDRPLAFVLVALTKGPARRVADLLDPDSAPLPGDRATAAVLYSISSIEPGLRGIPFGKALIDHALSQVGEELPQLGEFGTLSPVPGFRRWLGDVADARRDGEGGEYARLRRALEAGDKSDAHRVELERAVRSYLGSSRPHDSRSIDPVARFHLGNGARLDQVLIDADPSPAGRARSYGVMVTYTYERPTT